MAIKSETDSPIQERSTQGSAHVELLAITDGGGIIFGNSDQARHLYPHPMDSAHKGYFVRNAFYLSHGGTIHTASFSVTEGVPVWGTQIAHSDKPLSSRQTLEQISDIAHDNGSITHFLANLVMPRLDAQYVYPLAVGKTVTQKRGETIEVLAEHIKFVTYDTTKAKTPIEEPIASIRLDHQEHSITIMHGDFELKVNQKGELTLIEDKQQLLLDPYNELALKIMVNCIYTLRRILPNHLVFTDVVAALTNSVLESASPEWINTNEGDAVIFTNPPVQRRWFWGREKKAA